MDLVKIKITHLIKFADRFAGLEVHIPVGGKQVKLNYADDQFIEILRKLQQKEVTEVYVNSDDCKKVIDKLQESLSAKAFYDPKTVPEEQAQILDSSMAVVKSVINNLGMDVETVKLMKTINTRSMTMLAESPSLFAYVKRFKQNCSEEFLRTILTSYLMALIIDKFPWKSDQVKEKGALASILCDIHLEKEDFKEIHRWEREGGELDARIRRHPLDAAERLRSNRSLIPSEIITIVEQHHELPDGKGFPSGITATRFNQLSCIFIVSQQFIERLFDVEFDFERRMEIIGFLEKRYGSAKSFEKAIDALVSVIDG